MNGKTATLLNKYAGQGGFNKKQFKRAYLNLSHEAKGKAKKTMRRNLEMHRRQQEAEKEGAKK